MAKKKRIPKMSDLEEAKRTQALMLEIMPHIDTQPYNVVSLAFFCYSMMFPIEPPEDRVALHEEMLRSYNPPPKDLLGRMYKPARKKKAARKKRRA